MTQIPYDTKNICSLSGCLLGNLIFVLKRYIITYGTDITAGQHTQYDKMGTLW